MTLRYYISISIKHYRDSKTGETTNETNTFLTFWRLTS